MSNTVELILRVRAGQIYPPKHAKKIIYHQSNCMVIKKNSVQTSDYKKPLMWPVFRFWSLTRGSCIQRPPVLKGQNFWSPAWPLNTGFTVHSNACYLNTVHF